MTQEKLTPIIKDSFLQYAGAVLQSRALVDVRDCIKPSARQIFYCLYTDKFIHSKPFQKTLKAIGSAFRMYIHGDSSAEGIIMRAGAPYAYRYPLIEVEGSAGTLLAAGSWAAPRYCLTGDALISTNKGLIRIDKIIDSKENSDNPIDTLTCRGAFGLTTTNMIFNSGKQQTYELTLKNGQKICGTPNHPILTLNEDLEFVWKTIEELNTNDSILLNVKNNFLYGSENDLIYARALGCLISEGYLLNNKIQIINLDYDMMTPVKEILSKYHSQANITKRVQRDNCYAISTSNKELYERLEKDNCCHDSYNKHIPTSVFLGTREYQIEFLRYLFEGDGCISVRRSGYGTIAYSSVSEALIRELQILLLSNFGIVSTIHTQKNRNEIKLELGGEDVYIFGKNIGFVSEKKQTKLQSAMNYYKSCREKTSTGSRGWRIFPIIKSYLEKHHPKEGFITYRTNRPNDCKGPLMSKDGLKIFEAKLSEEEYSKISFIYNNFVLMPIIKKEDTGIQTVYSPKINESCNSYMANGIINHNTSARLSTLSEYLFADLDKETIEEWSDNYDNTEQYPMVLPSKGFYNIVNGNFGIAVGASSSVPQHNLKELNAALVKLLWNPNISFEDIYVAPDFATGGIILNGDEVKESYRIGSGHACKIRSVVEWDAKEKCFIVTEIPYMTYTETICKQLEEIINSEDNFGIERFNDLTGVKPLIKIYLKKNANPGAVLKKLYKNTSLEYYYGINFTMLENGRFPKTFTWKEMLQAHIDHEITVYRRGYEFDCRKIEKRLHIINGLLICMASINEVINTIKSSSNTADASKNLQTNFLLDELQAKAVLDMKLSKLAHLEVQKLENEKTDLETKLKGIQAILNDENLLKKEIEKGLIEVSNKFGDNRRTQIMNIESEEDGPIEVKAIQVSLTNKNNLLVSESSSLYTQKRGGVGNKFKLDKDEYIISTTAGSNIDLLLLFTDKGNSYNTPLSLLNIDEKIAIETLTRITSSERVCELITTSKNNKEQYIIFCTKKGMIKKSNLSEYKNTRAVKAISLDADDEICRVIFLNEEPIGLLTSSGHYIICETKNIKSIGRVAKGVKGISLSDNDTLVAADRINSNVKEILTITKNGYAKRTSINEISITGRGTKGIILHKLKDTDDQLVDFIPITNENNITVIASKAQLKTKIVDIPLLRKNTFGTKTIKIKENEKIIKILAN